ncbi:MAG: carotenoid biosynthesis protein [Gemmatimonadaceae bacterium]
MKPLSTANHSETKRAPRRPLGLWILYAVTIISLIGFATFGLHPELLAHVSPASVGFYSISFRFFAIGQVWLAGLVLIAFLIRHARFRWLPALLTLYAISLTSELLGTGYGITFGAYSYSEVLKPMWMGRVPLGIPMSWFYMSVPAYALASHALRRRSRVSVIAFASLILLAWDLALDPAMSHATQYWTWQDKGPYYGMPLLNLFGWYVTGIALMAALALLQSNAWIDQLPIRWLAGFYGANVLLALGMTAAAGLWGAVAATLIVLGAVAGFGIRATSRHPSPERSIPAFPVSA